MTRQEQPHERERQEAPAAVHRRPQVPDPARSPANGHARQPGVRQTPDQPDPVLPVGAGGRTRRGVSPQCPAARTQETAAQRRSAVGRADTAARSRDRTQRRELAAQKGALAIGPGRRYTADEKAVILKTVQQAQVHCPERALEAILGDLGLPSATYFRWVERAATGHLADRVVVPHRPAVPPTPAEVEAVTGYAHDHPLLGYKRLAYALMLENKAFVRPWMVRAIMAEHELLGRRQPPPEPLVRPPEADHPDQRWHR